MSEHVVKERIGLPIWDDDLVVDIRHFLPGDTITTEDFEGARQDEDEQEMLVQYNCYTDDELKQLEEDRKQEELRAASVTDGNEPLPSQEER